MSQATPRLHKIGNTLYTPLGKGPRHSVHDFLHLASALAGYTFPADIRRRCGGSGVQRRRPALLWLRSGGG
ncbi:predicted protein [Plenodomus lingam JN3]|uniref:Predicted protein n=1 Tax=Leptosphaeria maculans (strain JN3 / isolate v23.1.3 / race Av1-4-5-6-7-8) TaxID=985895 RepID=E4ZUK7_LEPMJ|nr:predicted protein [Plenodomus lingam JN3]CBX95086.1 predicted protein [Plenodomus lingam JN3]